MTNFPINSSLNPADAPLPMVKDTQIHKILLCICLHGVGFAPCFIGKIGKNRTVLPGGPEPVYNSIDCNYIKFDYGD